MRTRILLLAASLLASILLLVSTSALPAVAANEPTQAASALIANSTSIAAKVRKAFFCETSSCNRDRTALVSAAASALKSLGSGLPEVAVATFPSKLNPIVQKFALDASSLIAAFKLISKAKGKLEAASIIGIMSYETANVQSDSYVFQTLKAGRALNFRLWGVGVVAVMHALLVDNQTLSANPNSASTAFSVDQNQLLEAQSLKSDANGPQASFNALLVEFANNQIRMSQDLINYLNGKGGRMTNSQVSALGNKLASEYANIGLVQNRLASHS
jgi:hypothetical protein